MKLPNAADPHLSVGYVSPAWPRESTPNGIVTYIENLTKTLMDNGHHVSIISSVIARGIDDPTIYDFGQPTTQASLPIRLANILAYRLAHDATNQHHVLRRLIDAIRRAISEQNMQILQIEDSFGWAWWVRKTTSIPLCVRLHGPWFLNGTVLGLREDSRYRRRVKNERRGILSADMITAPSQDVLDRTREYYGLPLTDAAVIPNPIYPVAQPDRWQLNECDAKRILFIGRFDRHKGGDLLIESFARVLETIPDARLTIVGPDKTCIADDGQRWGLEDFIRDRLPGTLESGQVEWLGQQPSSALHSLRRKALITVIPSRYETFGNTVTEAMNLGCPIVAAKTGGIKEIVSDTFNGLVHRPGDVNDLADKIILLLKDPALAAKLGANAAADVAQRFHPGIIAARHIEVYRSMIARKLRDS